MKPFSYESEFTIKINGDFRSGTQLFEFKLYLDFLDNEVLYNDLNFKLDLTNVIFMDSDSYDLVLKLSNRDATIIWNKDSKVYERYLDFIEY